MAADPIHQFQIQNIVPLLKVGAAEIHFTNSAAFMILGVVLTALLLLGATAGRHVVPTRLQSVAELTYELVASTLRSSAGEEAMKFFPFVFSLFMFVLFGNLIGMVPYSFTYTSHIAVTFALAAFIFIGVTVIALARHGWHFFTFFAPKGMPLALQMLLVPIEIISYLIRPMTLSIRLFANMMAGHTMLFIFASFVTALGVFGILPLVFNMGFILLEFLVAVLQAYVFTILTCIYLHDAIHLH